MSIAAGGLLAYAVPILLVVLSVGLFAASVRLILGPGYADRFIALDMLTAIAVAAAAMSAVVTGRREFLDVAFGLALIGFVATIAFAAFLEKKKEDTR